MKITFCLKEPKLKEKTIIYMICRWNSKQYKISTKLSVQPQFWNPIKFRVKDTNKISDVHSTNNSLYEIESIARDIFNKFIYEYKRKPSGDELRTSLKKVYFDKEPLFSKNEIKTVSDYFDLYINTIKTDVTNSTTLKYEQAKKNFEEFEKLNRSVFNVDQFDNRTRNKYVDFLVNVKNYKPTTIYRKMKFLKTVFLFAKSIGVNIHPFIENRNFLTKDVEVDNIALSETELLEMESLDLSNNKRLEQVRDLFLVACYTGQRFSDLNKINQSNIIDDAYISIRQQKTKEPLTLPLLHSVRKILQKYDYKLPKLSNVKFNDYIKEVAEKCNTLNKPFNENVLRFKMVSSHTARRTFVTLNYGKGIDLDILRLGTGHKQTKTLQSYIKMNDKQKADLLRSKLENK